MEHALGLKLREDDAALSLLFRFVKLIANISTFLLLLLDKAVMLYSLILPSTIGLIRSMDSSRIDRHCKTTDYLAQSLQDCGTLKELADEQSNSLTDDNYGVAIYSVVAVEQHRSTVFR